MLRLSSALALLAAGSSHTLLVRADTVYTESSDYASGALGAGPYESFYSSSITPNIWNFAVPLNESTKALAAPGLILSSARGTDCVQPGAVIHDQDGNLVYSAYAVAGQTMQFTKTTYQGADVLLVWTGEFRAAGYGFGRNLLLSTSYEVVANFTTIDLDSEADFHEAGITVNDTALMTSYVISSYDLSNYTDGLTDGYIAAGHFQEIDVASNTLLFTWNSLDHIDPSLGYATPGTTGTSEADPWDYLHINSIDKDDAGNYLISCRHTHALYYIDGSSGDILWSLGGMNSSFTMGDNTTFTWQHDARWRANQTQISVFDNAATSWESDADYARGMLLDVDTQAMTVELAQEFLPWNRTVSPSQGNVQVLEDGNGNSIVGWGQTPRFSEFTSDGTLIQDIAFGSGNVQAYRFFKANWTAYPTTLPDVAVFPNGTSSVYVSWNGATEVASWALYGSNDASTTTSLVNTTKSGFETALNTTDLSYAYYQVAGLDASNQVLGYSSFVSANGTSEAPAATQTAQVGSNATSTASASESSSSNSTSGTVGGVSVSVGLTLAVCFAVVALLL